MSVSTFVQPDFTSQTETAYKTNLDAAVDVFKRVSLNYAPHESATPNMIMQMEAGHFFNGELLVISMAGGTATITAPSANPRIDRVVINRADGSASVITGVENASPVVPTIPGNAVPLAQIALVVGQTEIVNADITDERDLYRLGTGQGTFMASSSAGQSVSVSTFTKIQYNIENFDINNEYNESTYRFLPQIKGQYLISAIFSLLAVSDGIIVIVTIYKNGSPHKQDRMVTGAAVEAFASISILVEANGTSDYFEVFVWHNDSAPRSISTAAVNSQFSGTMVRAGG